MIASTLNGGSHTDFQRTKKLLGLPYMSYPTYKTVEEDVSNNFDITSKEAMHAALLEELELSPDFYTIEKYGKLKALTISVDMGWQKEQAAGYTIPHLEFCTLLVRARVKLYIRLSTATPAQNVRKLMQWLKKRKSYLPIIMKTELKHTTT